MSSSKAPEYVPPEELKINGISAIIVDPHNEVFFYWVMRYQGLARQGLDPAKLIHVDRHADNGTPHYEFESDIKVASKEEIWEYTKSLYIDQFILPARDLGVIQVERVSYDPWREKGVDKISFYEDYPLYDRSLHRYERFRNFQNYEGEVWWNIDLDAFNCIRFGQRFENHGTLDSRMADTEEFLTNMPRPSLITIALSQTPEIYVDPELVGAVKDRTLATVERITSGDLPVEKKWFPLSY
tara:strand:- start:210 stop:932 length:723 start_codon:yes stop_codon:yes gene_type:complete